MRAALALLAASLASAQAEPIIVQPGAPGQPSRVIAAERSEALARAAVQPADVAFMRAMIVHHAQAIDMVKLIGDRSHDRDVQLLGARISMSQASEIHLMRDWLAQHAADVKQLAAGSDAGVPRADMNSMDMEDGVVPMRGRNDVDPDTPVMPGMLSPRQMAALAAASGAQFDRLFLKGMIQHHQGALDMVHALAAIPRAGEEAALCEFLISVSADQTAEIARMQAILARLGS